MDAITGLCFAVRWICRHIRSLASASPPGLSTRSTTAATPCSRMAPSELQKFAAKIQHSPRANLRILYPVTLKVLPEGYKAALVNCVTGIAEIDE